MLHLHTLYNQKYTFADMGDNITESQTQVQMFLAPQGSWGISFFPNKHRALMIHTVKDYNVISHSKTLFQV